jgi:ubiquitin-protein ligase
MFARGPQMANGASGPSGAELRERRIRNEWELLQAFKGRNPCTLHVLEHCCTGEDDTFYCTLEQTSGIVIRDGIKVLERSHLAELRFPRFFPSVPIEARLAIPVFHPNVDPQSGFVCLWERSSASDTVMEAVRRLQLVISWESFNLKSDQVIHPAAVQWYLDQNRIERLPFEFTPLLEVEEFRLMKSYSQGLRGSRRRLEATKL